MSDDLKPTERTHVETVNQDDIKAMAENATPELVALMESRVSFAIKTKNRELELERALKFWELREKILDSLNCSRQMLLEKKCGCSSCTYLIEIIESI